VFGGPPGIVTGTEKGLELRVADLRNHRVSIVPGSQGLFSPCWSPDGRYLKAVTADSTKMALFDFMNRRWTGLTKITAGFTHWSPDSMYIYFDDFEAKQTVTYRINFGARQN